MTIKNFKFTNYKTERAQAANLSSSKDTLSTRKVNKEYTNKLYSHFISRTNLFQVDKVFFLKKRRNHHEWSLPSFALL
jgi:hypothetical protein